MKRIRDLHSWRICMNSWRDPANATILDLAEADELVANLTRDEGDKDPWVYKSEPYGSGYIVSVCDDDGLLGYL